MKEHVSPSGAPRPRVIVVEDDPPSRDLMQRLLEPEFDVVLAESGVALRRLMRGLPPHGVVILMDLSLGPTSETGLDLTAELRHDRRWGNAPIIAVTALIDSQVRRIALRAGVDVFHEKPVRPRRLVTEIRELLGREDSPIPN